jgi:hypothetical protein
MQHKKLTPLFFFVSLGTVIALIASVSALIRLSFETLNHVFPDVLTDTYQYGYVSYSYDVVRNMLALLIIVFPIFLILERYWTKVSRGALSEWNATLRKWAIYIILFLASITIIADLVTLVNYFVAGEITTRFMLKVTLTLLVAGMTGWYYIRKLQMKRGWQWFGIGATVLVLAMIIWSFSVIGSPANQRKLRMDQRRLEDLQSIQWQVISYWQQKEKLPETLAEMNNPLASYMVPQDPEFQKGKVYEYSKTGAMSFELCATFDLPQPKGWVPGTSGGGVYPMATRDVAVSAIAPYPGGTTDSWDHKEGRACFTRTIDRDLYPPFPKQVQ